MRRAAALPAALLAAVLLMAALASPTPAAIECTIRGTNGDDTLFGTSGRDVICGRRGDDLIFGGDGRDRLFGQRGNDRLFAKDGFRDIVRGGSGSDVCVTDPGDRAYSCEERKS